MTNQPDNLDPGAPTAWPRWAETGERFAAALARRWSWLVWGAAMGAACGFAAGFFLTAFQATTTLICEAPPAFTLAGEPAKAPRTDDLHRQTMLAAVRSPALARQAAAASPVPVLPEWLDGHASVEPVPGTDLVRVTVRGHDPDQVIVLANTLASAAVAHACALESNGISTFQQWFARELAEVDARWTAADQALSAFQRSAGVLDFERDSADLVRQRAELGTKGEDLRVQLAALDLEMAALKQEIARHHPAILATRQLLDRARLRYTDEHPKVLELRATLQSLEAQLATRTNEVDPEIVLQGSSLAQGLYHRLVELRTRRLTLARQREELAQVQAGLDEKLARQPGQELEFARLKSDVESLKETRNLLLKRQQERQRWAQPGPGGLRIIEPAGRENLDARVKWRAAWQWAPGGGALGAALAGVIVLGLAAVDRRIRSAADLRRATRLPVMAALDDLNRLSEREREQWALHTWTALRARLAPERHGALVCGFVSSGHGEGRSTWIRLLADIAAKQGYRVLVIAAGGNPQTHPPLPAQSATAATTTTTTTSSAVLAASVEVAPASLAPGTQVTVPMPTEGWVWNTSGRQQWREALAKLGGVEELVVFVELPPASEAEGILLAEDFGQLIWLCGKDMADVNVTRSQLETLRCSRSRVAGVVFNCPAPRRRAPASPGARVLAGLAITLALLPRTLPAQAPPPAVTAVSPLPAATNGLSISSPAQLAPWQERFTLGPGDLLNISMYEQPDSLRANVTIGPDGRLNYLQARDVVAADLTVEELREKLEQVLLKFYRPPIRVVVLPQLYASKKYYILGNVAQRGVFALDRPITIIEAIARAQGFITAAQRRNTLLQADLARSFLVRKQPSGQFARVPVDFEALFLHGDLRQNIGLAPDDYLYFPQVNLQEVYVVGPGSAGPGVLPYSPDLTVLRAIIARGGFAEKAYRSRALVVRGSLDRPLTFTVNTADTLAGKSLDFKLEPRDIVYLSRRPWAKAEELLEAAISDFLRSAVVGWTGENIGPFITEPLIK